MTPLAKWRLLGPMTAMNGVLMFGWSTALIFEVLIMAIGKYDASRSADRGEALLTLLTPASIVGSRVRP